MKRFTTTTTITVLILAVFAGYSLFTPSSAYAKWDDRSDELPGMDNSVGTYLLIGAGLLAAGTVVYLIAKHGKDDSKKTDSDSTEATSEEETAIESSTDYEDSTEQEVGTLKHFTKPQPDLNLYFNVTPESFTNSSDNKAFDFSDVTVRVGVSLEF